MISIIKSLSKVLFITYYFFFNFLIFCSFADKVILKNGEEIEGIVVERNHQEITIKIDVGEISLKTEKIEKIIKLDLPKKTHLKINQSDKEIDEKSDVNAEGKKFPPKDTSKNTDLNNTASNEDKQKKPHTTIQKFQRADSDKYIEFSGYRWKIKYFSHKIGPGPNYFSNLEESVWVDKNGYLHMKIIKAGDRWLCSEIILQESLGYGTYIFYLGSATDTFDQNVVLGIFNWDNYARNKYNHEFGIEISRWGSSSKRNVQYVVQPAHISGNKKRFENVESDRPQRYSYSWAEDKIIFDSIDIDKKWIYSGKFIPEASQENVRINLWLYQGAPPKNGRNQEVIVRKFIFRPHKDKAKKDNLLEVDIPS